MRQVMGSRRWGFFVATLCAAYVRAQDVPSSTEASKPTAPPVRDGVAPAVGEPSDSALRGAAANEPIPSTRDWRHMSAREKRALEAFVQQSFPEVWDEVGPLQKQNSKAYNEQMGRLAVELVDILEERSANPSRGDLLLKEKQLEYRIQGVVSELLTAIEPQRQERLREKLSELVTKQFEVVQERWALDVQRLEEKVSVLKKRLEDHARNRDQIIRNRVETRLNPGAVDEKSRADKPEKTDKLEKSDRPERTDKSEPAGAANTLPRQR